MEQILTRLRLEYPGYSFEVKKGNYGQQLLINSRIVANTWDLVPTMNAHSDFAESIKDMNAEDSMYYFFKYKIDNFLKK